MKTLLKCIIVLLVSMQLQAQVRLIIGKLTSASDNSPLPGVMVLVKGTRKMLLMTLKMLEN